MLKAGVCRRPVVLKEFGCAEVRLKGYNQLGCEQKCRASDKNRKKGLGIYVYVVVRDSQLVK